MKKLNPITALYLKILEFISKLMIKIGEAGERPEKARNATPEDYEWARRTGRRYRRYSRFMDI